MTGYQGPAPSRHYEAIDDAYPTSDGRAKYGTDTIILMYPGLTDRPPARVERFRVQVRRDFYEHQSSYRVSVWHDYAWREVASLDPSTVTAPSPVVWQSARQACLDAVEAVTLRLLSIAEDVVFEPNSFEQAG